MTISYCKQTAHTCSQCDATFRTEVWLILDAQEQPEAVQALHQGQLNQVSCPHCGQVHSARTPFLFHDAAAHCVMFAAPPGVEQHIWQEQARELHTLLVQNIPAEQRRPYLSDVQIAQDIVGIAHRLGKIARRHGTGTDVQDEGGPRSQEKEEGEPYTCQPDNHQLPTHNLVAVVQALLAADSFDEFRAIVVERYPILLEPDTDETLRQFANTLFEQREYDMADCLNQARHLIHQIQMGHAEPYHAHQHPDERVPLPEELPGDIYHALLQATTSDEVHSMMQSYPILQQERVDLLFNTILDRVLAEAYDRLALILLQRWDVLIELRQKVQNGRSHVETHTSL